MCAQAQAQVEGIQIGSMKKLWENMVGKCMTKRVLEGEFSDEIYRFFYIVHFSIREQSRNIIWWMLLYLCFYFSWKCLGNREDLDPFWTDIINMSVTL